MILYPILESQKGVLLECLENPQVTYYNLSTITAIPRSISREKLVTSLHKAIDFLPVLKTRFLTKNNKLQQGYDENIKINVKSHNLNHKEMTELYFQEYNNVNPHHQMQAPMGVGYVFAEKIRSAHS